MEETTLEELEQEILALEKEAAEAVKPLEVQEEATPAPAPAPAAAVEEVVEPKPKPKPKAKVKAEKAPEPKPEPQAANTTPLFGAARIKSKLVGYQRK
jgi:hypothetical protein